MIIRSHTVRPGKYGARKGRGIGNPKPRDKARSRHCTWRSRCHPRVWLKMLQVAELAWQVWHSLIEHLPGAEVIVEWRCEQTWMHGKVRLHCLASAHHACSNRSWNPPTHRTSLFGLHGMHCFRKSVVEIMGMIQKHVATIRWKRTMNTHDQSKDIFRICKHMWSTQIFLSTKIFLDSPRLPMNHDLYMTRDRASKAVFSRKMSGTLIFLRGFGVCDPCAAFVVGA